MLKRKKEESLKSLSEREIQEKLYGRYRAAEGNLEDGSGRAHASDAGTFFSVPSFAEGKPEAGREENSQRLTSTTAIDEALDSEAVGDERSKPGFLSSLRKLAGPSSPLNEREIQEKLYGHFVRQDPAERKVSGNENARTDSPEAMVFQKTSVDSPVKEGPGKVQPGPQGKKNGRKKGFSVWSWLIGFSPALNEREIQKKLYGCCETGSMKTVMGRSSESGDRLKEVRRDRESAALFSVPEGAKKPFLAPPQEWLSLRKKTGDLFAVATAALSEIFRSVFSWVVTALAKVPVSRLAGVLAAGILIFVAFRMSAQWRTASIDLLKSGKSFGVSAGNTDAAPKATVDRAAQTKVSSEPEVTITPAPVPAAIPKKFYTIQVVVYEDSKLAQNLIEDFKGKKLDAFMVQTTTRRGRQHYEVFVGHFPSVSEADQHLSQYRKKSFLKDFPDSFIRPRFE